MNDEGGRVSGRLSKVWILFKSVRQHDIRRLLYITYVCTFRIEKPQGIRRRYAFNKCKIVDAASNAVINR